MSEKEPKERKDYMREKKENLDSPPSKKEGLEEPRETGLPKVKMGFIIFIVIVLIILIVGIAMNMFGIDSI